MMAAPGQPREPARAYTARLTKSSALVPEMRKLVLEWDDDVGRGKRLVQENVLASPTRSRSNDVVTRAFLPRYVHSRPPDLWRPLAILEREGWQLQALLPLHYFAAASAEPILRDFVSEFLAPRYAIGHLEVTVDDAKRFLARAPADRYPRGRWGESVTERVAQGLLATLRDFGVLSGAVKKRVTPIYLPVPSFAFLAKLRTDLGAKGRALLVDPCWQLFYLSETAVERLFVEAQQEGLLAYNAAGSVIRVDFPARDLEDYAHVVARRA